MVAVAAAPLAVGFDEVVLGHTTAVRTDLVVMPPTDLLKYLETNRR